MAAGALPPPVFLLVSLLDRNSPLLPTRRTRRVYRLVTLCFTLEKQECPLILGVFSSTLRCVCFFFFGVEILGKEREIYFSPLPLFEAFLLFFLLSFLTSFLPTLLPPFPQFLLPHSCRLPSCLPSFQSTLLLPPSFLPTDRPSFLPSQTLPHFQGFR